MDSIKENLYKNIDLDDIDQNSIYNIRENGMLFGRHDSNEIKIETKEDNPGINITVNDNCKGEVVQIPVIITKSGINDLVYNDFIIGDNVEVTILAGCAIHNDCDNDTTHSGIHTFKIGKNSKVKYVEKHFGCGTYERKSINTDTYAYIGENSEFIMDTTQVGGLDKAVRKTYGNLVNNSSFIVKEKLLSANKESIKTIFNVLLNGENSKCNIESKSIAKNKSKQSFESTITGKNKCFGHVECNAILMDKAYITSLPKIISKTPEAILTHEASIGKISEDEIIKLMTLGLTEKQAEDEIIRGFLN